MISGRMKPIEQIRANVKSVPFQTFSLFDVAFDLSECECNIIIEF